MRADFSRFQIVVALLVAMLAGGKGLPGIVWALSGGDAHVCTCAAGSSHAACPVCSHALRVPSQGRLPVVDGSPCGDHHQAQAEANQPGVLPAPQVAPLQWADRIAAPRADRNFAPDRHVEPATPPPRVALPG